MNNQKTGASYGFVAPEIAEDSGKNIRRQFPTFGIVETDLTGNIAEVDVTRTEQVIKIGGGPLSATAILNLKVAEGLDAGCKCYVQFNCGATACNVKVKTNGMVDCELAGVANSQKTVAIVWIGNKWMAIE